MSLRPRYSLLTLLVVTALVAGGVKLWHGPHHVVERTKPDEEVEYTYTRDWDGTKIPHGPQVIRLLGLDGTHERITVVYQRHGTVLPCYYDLMREYSDESDADPPTDHWEFVRSKLSRAEYEELQQTMLREKQHDPGRGLIWTAHMIFVQ